MVNFGFLIFAHVMGPTGSRGLLVRDYQTKSESGNVERLPSLNGRDRRERTRLLLIIYAVYERYVDNPKLVTVLHDDG
jgi:hypothetical protein